MPIEEMRRLLIRAARRGQVAWLVLAALAGGVYVWSDLGTWLAAVVVCLVVAAVEEILIVWTRAMPAHVLTRYERMLRKVGLGL